MAGLFLCLISPLAAQAPASGDVVLHSTTRLVQMNVIVQDKKGEPVADLKKEDFQIFDRGKPQQLTLFSVESNAALPTAPKKLAPNVFTNTLSQHSGAPASVTVILLDALNTKFEDQVYAKQQIVKFLRTIHPEDCVALYALGGGLRVLHDYTTDSTDLLRKLAAYRGENLPDLSASETTSLSGADTLQLNSWLRGGATGAEADFYMVNRVQGTLRAIEFIANHLATLPGRKNLIWVSGGFPLDIGFDDPESMHDASRERRTFSEEVDRTVRAVNNANLAIYPVDARGLVTDARFSAENRTVDLTPKLAMGPVVKNQETMRELASRTGGRAYYNTNDLKNAIRDAIQDSRVTYTLGFYPKSETFDGKFHELKVKIDRPGINARYRKGYFDLPEKQQDPKTRNTELRDAVWSPLDASGLGLIVQIQPAETPNALTVYVRVDPRGISMQPLKDRWGGKLDFLFVQKNDRGKEFNGISDTVDLNLVQANYDKLRKEGLIYRKQITQSPQANLLRVVARDAPSGTLGSVSVPFNQLVRMPAKQ